MIIFNFIKKYLPKLIYWKRATWTRSQWFCYDYMKLFLKYKENNEYQAQKTNEEVPNNQVIWIYWKQGEKNAPPIVKKCISSIRNKAGKHPVIVLDQENLHKYIIMPDFIEQKHIQNKISEAHYSDLLRISLLIVYGGFWCDATCLLTSSIPEIIENSSFFMFNRDLLCHETSPCECSNWFIKADKNNIILIKLRNILFHYFKKHSAILDYYIFHITLGLMIHTDTLVKSKWEEKPYICNMNPHVLLFSFSKPYDEAKYKHILNSCFIHKLTYKYNKKLIMSGSKNIITHLLNNKFTVDII